MLIDWQTGEPVFHRKLDFGKQRINFHFIQPIEYFYLLLGARSKQHRDGRFDHNAVIEDEYGARIRSFCLGDGIQQCLVDQQNHILTSYFDEGVFGDNPVGNSGLVRWSSQGEMEWENPFCSISDCYAMNLDAKDNLWFYYYTEFDLVKTDYEKHWTFSPGISGSSGFLLGQDGVSILFQGGYNNQKYYRMQLREGIFAHQGDRVLILGAYGCGVFRNDPVEVARWWQELLAEGFGGCFDRIVHAELDTSKNQNGINAFQ